MKLPRYIATTPPSRETGLVRAQDIEALTRIGGIGTEYGKSLTRLGGVIKDVTNLGFQAYMHRQELDDIIESGVASQRVQESWNKIDETVTNLNPMQDMPLPDDPNYLKTLTTLSKDKIDAMLPDLLKDVEKDANKIFSGIRNPKTKAKLVKQYNENYAERVKRIKSNLNAKLNNYQLDEMNKLATAAARSGNMEASDYYVDKMAEHGLIEHTTATKLKQDNNKLSIRETVTELYRNGFHDEAREVLEASILGSKEKEMLDDEIDKDERTKVIEFESGINDELVRIDNAPNMTQADFNEQAKQLKNKILVANLDGTQKKKMLADLEKWRRGTNEIDYTKILSLNQEMDAAQRSGIVDPTIQTRIMRASLEGAFGGRLKGGQKTYGDMIRRFEKLKFDERLQATSSIVTMFERENADDARLIFLFHEAKNKFISENPDIDTKEMFIKISGLAESYSVLPERAIERKMQTKKKTVIMTGPKGHMFMVPIGKKQLFIDNGYTEQ